MSLLHVLIVTQIALIKNKLVAQRKVKYPTRVNFQAVSHNHTGTDRNKAATFKEYSTWMNRAPHG